MGPIKAYWTWFSLRRPSCCYQCGLPRDLHYKVFFSKQQIRFYVCLFQPPPKNSGLQFGLDLHTYWSENWEFNSEMNVTFTLCQTALEDRRINASKSWSTAASGENLESESVLALFFSPTFNAYIRVQTHARTHTCRHKHRYTYAYTHTHTMNTRTALPNSTLLMCEMSKGLISWKHTTEPEEK